MKQKLRYILYSIFIFFNCCKLENNSTIIIQNSIVGEWYPLDNMVILKDRSTDEIEIRNAKNFNMTGYQFMENGICKNNLGFYEYIDQDALVLDHPYKQWRSEDESDICTDYIDDYKWLGNIKHSFGNQTSYLINNDTLKIFNPSKKDWDKYKIDFLSHDTLSLLSDKNNTRELYVRKYYISDKEQIVDQIICYYPLTCTSNRKFFSIQCSDDFISCEYFNNDRKFQATKMKEGTFRQIERLFKKAETVSPLMNIQLIGEDEGRKEKASTMRYSIYEPKITFVKNGKTKTLNSIFYDVSLENREFYWAYLSTLFLFDYEDIKCNVINFESSIGKLNLDDFDSFLFIKNDSIQIKIHPTERFYLATLLYQARKVIEDFKAIYKLEGIKDHINKIETDGRYFRYTSKEGKEITLDIGFNFIEVNGLDQASDD